MDECRAYCESGRLEKLMDAQFQQLFKQQPESHAALMRMPMNIHLCAEDFAVTPEHLEAHKTWLKTKGQQGTRLKRNLADLQYIDLTEANLENSNLQGSHLDGAMLPGANLQRATLYSVSLYGANLQGAQLQGANLRRANLKEAKLAGANLQGADLSRGQSRGYCSRERQPPGC